MNNFLRARHVIALAALLVFAFITIVFKSPAVAAPAIQPRPTPRPCDEITEESGQTRNVGQACSPQTAKAKTTFGGGGDSLGVCNDDYLAPEGVPVWGVYPPYGWVAFDKPHVLSDIIVERCNWREQPDFDATITLLDPSGDPVASESGDFFTYDFPEETMQGTYTLLIESEAGVLAHDLTVVAYEGPRFTLRSPVTGQPLENSNFTGLPWQDGIQVDYAGFTPNMPVEVTLHTGGIWSQSKWSVLDSWQFMADDAGAFSEVLQFDADLPVAERAFLLVACSLDSCSVDFSGVEPFGDNGVFVPPMAWESFALTQYRPEPRASGFMRCAKPCDESFLMEMGPIPGGTRRAHFTWDFADVPVGASYTRSWRVVGKGEWVRYECTWPGPMEGSEYVTLSEPGGLYSGIWELIIEVDGQEILREQVEVDGDWIYWEPAGVFDRCR